MYRGSPTSTVSTSTNFRAIGIKLVLVEFLPDCYVVKLVLVEIGYVIPTSTNFAQYNFFQIPKIVLSKDPLYLLSLVFKTKVELSKELRSNFQKKLLKCKVIIFWLYCVCMLSVLEFKLLLDPYIIILSPLQNCHCSLLDGCIPM